MIYLVNIDVYWSKCYTNKLRLNIIDAAKDPQEYCIEKLYPEMSNLLLDFVASQKFFFALR